MKRNEKKGYKERVLIPIAALLLVVIFVTVADRVNGGKESAASAPYSSEYYSESVTASTITDYTFRSSKLLTSHFEKHGKEVGAKDEMQYVDKANAVISNPDALYKTEAEDGDGVYFLQATGEIVFLSTDGYIRTYYIADYDYFNRQ